ncbi:MAG: hypothetical protein IT371_07725 [Deltaproteobacteria bacterium]|nr:hypothetical protein [Deltaproteobacteria bacterium]
MASRRRVAGSAVVVLVSVVATSGAWAKSADAPPAGQKPARGPGLVARIQQTRQAIQKVRANLDQADPETSTSLGIFRLFTTHAFRVEKVNYGLLGSSPIPRDLPLAVGIYAEASRQGLAAWKAAHQAKADLAMLETAGGPLAAFMINWSGQRDRVGQVQKRITESMWKATGASWLGTLMNYVHWARKLNSQVTEREALAYFLYDVMSVPTPQDVAVLTRRAVETELVAAVQNWVSPMKEIHPPMNVYVDRGYVDALPRVTTPFEAHVFTDPVTHAENSYTARWGRAVEKAAAVQEADDRATLQRLAQERAARR